MDIGTVFLIALFWSVFGVLPFGIYLGLDNNNDLPMGQATLLLFLSGPSVWVIFLACATWELLGRIK